MRTTLTLDDDVRRLVEGAMHRRRASMKSVINDALRSALAPDPAAKPYRVRVHHSQLAPGVDALRLNHLVAELADESHIATLLQAEPVPREDQP